MSGTRGSVILQVLMAGIILAYIAASLLRMTLQPSLSSANALKSVRDSKAAEASLNRVRAAWSLGGDTCASDSSVGVDCGSHRGTCGCACAVSDLPQVVSTPAGGACSLTVRLP